ncbi:MAG: hypothetical protein EP336_01320 [Rhodobacteraceae bacterium]|nr:MAG: hypothetical protein EP336_01320 [Paracoccaceae bacterium]
MTELTCPTQAEKFTAANCTALRIAVSYEDFAGYIARCASIPPQTPLAFLEHGRCKGPLGLPGDPLKYSAAEAVILTTRDYQFFDFYQSLLNFMEQYWHVKLDAENTLIESQITRLHNVGCMIGAVYYQHPELNAAPEEQIPRLKAHAFDQRHQTKARHVKRLYLVLRSAKSCVSGFGGTL